LKSLVALSTGETIQYPKYYVKAEQKLAVAQRDLSRKKKGSSARQKAKIKVARLHQKIQNHRDEFLHQVSRKIVDSADLIVFETEYPGNAEEPSSSKAYPRSRMGQVDPVHSKQSCKGMASGRTVR